MATRTTKKAPVKKAAKATEKKTGSKVYKCGSCGMVTTEKGHLCDPHEIKKVYTCEYCGVAASDPRHVCKPKVSKMSYVCDACGRVAVEKGHLCEPVKIKG
jgi:DNA-directed RNA polymerase subunit RPC12/RpoP